MGRRSEGGLIADVGARNEGVRRVVVREMVTVVVTPERKNKRPHVVIVVRTAPPGWCSWRSWTRTRRPRRRFPGRVSARGCATACGSLPSSRSRRTGAEARASSIAGSRTRVAFGSAPPGASTGAFAGVHAYERAENGALVTHMREAIGFVDAAISGGGQVAFYSEEEGEAGAAFLLASYLVLARANSPEDATEAVVRARPLCGLKTHEEFPRTCASSGATAYRIGRSATGARANSRDGSDGCLFTSS